MSSLIVISKKTGVYIGTDTISHIKEEGKVVPKSFVSKTVYLPQFKCCFAVQGFVNLVSQLFSFANKKVVAYDAASFFQVCKNHFFNYLNTEDHTADYIGIIFIIGYSNEVQSMRTYKMIVTKKKIEFEELGDCSFIKPDISNLEEIIQKVDKVGAKDLDWYKLFFTEVMKQQIKQDTELPIQDKVGIGGQLQFTYIPPLNDDDDNPIYLIEMAHTFEHYMDDYGKMLGM